MWSVQKEEEEKEEKEQEVRWLESVTGWLNKYITAKLKRQRIEICVHRILSVLYVEKTTEVKLCWGVSLSSCEPSW